MATNFRLIARREGVALALLASTWCACSSSADAQADGAFGGPPVVSVGGSSATSPGASGGSFNIGTGGTSALPPEMELDTTFRAPVATGRVLWSSNPDSGRVALIDAQTLKVRMTNAGFGPTYLAAVPSEDGTDSAIVLNVGSHDASFMQASADQIAVTAIPTNSGDNSWAISRDGRFAIAWTDATQVQGTLDPSDGLSELTVIDLSAMPPASTRLSVGFRPSQIVFDATDAHAYAVVDEGISIIDLSGTPLVSSLVTLSAPGTSARDVNISPDGSFAVVRVNGNPKIDVVDFTSAGSVTQTVTLESDATDLDLSADGTVATAVLGNDNPPKVVRFPVPNPGDPSAFATVAIPGELVRSVTLAPNDQIALLYANAVPSSDLTLLDVSGSAGFRTVDLKGAVQKVFVSPDSSAAIALQLPPAGSTEKGLFSIVPTDVSASSARPPEIVGTDAVPQDVAFSSPDVGKALVTVHDSASTVHGVYVIGLANLEQNFVPLASAPLPGATGIVPDVKVGFVAQQHPEGRITFINLDTGVTQTLTGFEIAASVVE
ncbi:MAG TPA: hypothetical protein VHV51_19370 [Polyangiaceae bacterium]|jgi:hypothetical protein|nr:hypothetical protein [Polyangiaceae bacterium]